MHCTLRQKTMSGFTSARQEQEDEAPVGTKTRQLKTGKNIDWYESLDPTCLVSSVPDWCMWRMLYLYVQRTCITEQIMSCFYQISFTEVIEKSFNSVI